MKGSRISAFAVVALFVFSLAVVSSLGAVPRDYAATSLSTWCGSNGSSSSYSGTTCTVTGFTTMSTDVEISSGGTLAVTGSFLINSGVTLTVDSGGTITISNAVGFGFDNSGTINEECSGTITGSITEESDGIYNSLAGCSTSSTTTSTTTTTTTPTKGVPEFPALSGLSVLGPLLLIALLLPALLIITRKFRKPLL